MRKALTVIGALGLVAGFAMPATAAETETTFTLTASGGLAITAPTATDLGSASSGGTLSAALGAVQATDDRGALGGSWTASVSSSPFTTGGATAEETIPASAVTYLSGPQTAFTGVAAFTPGQTLVAVALGSTQTAFSAAATVGNNSVTWDPTVAVNVPAQAVVGGYTGTITHSVA